MKFTSNLKKISRFIVEVLKTVYKYTHRKIKEHFVKKLNGRTASQMFKEDFSNFASNVKSLSFASKALGTAFLVLIICFGIIHGYCTTHFLPGTVINGVDVSELSLDESKEALQTSCDNYILTLLEKNGQTEIISGEDIGLKVTFDDSYNDILKLKSGYYWLTAIIRNENANPKDTVLYSYNQSKLDEKISSLECLNVSNPKQPVNAELYYQDGEFKIRPSLTGDEVDLNKLKSRIIKAVANQEKSVDLESDGIYKIPEIQTDDPALLAKKQSYDGLLGLDIALKIGDNMETITPENAIKWCKTNPDGNLVSDGSLLGEYVDQLALKYNTVNLPKQFVTHYGNIIEISNSYYGWELDTDFALSTLSSYINERKSVTLDLTDHSEESNNWWLKTSVKYSNTDYYGDTYAEVSIDEQYMWMYQNGNIVFESEVVTGTPDSEHDTPVGIYSIIYKEENATLKGDEYETVVAYWMVFTYDIGFHDADWQDAFGEGIYEYSGSHGCVNLPVEAAGELYDLVYPNMPVFVY